MIFGEDLSPEVFDKNMPPSTPVSRGAHADGVAQGSGAVCRGPTLIELAQQLADVNAQLQAMSGNAGKAAKNRRKRLKQKQAGLNDRLAVRFDAS